VLVAAPEVFEKASGGAASLLRQTEMRYLMGNEIVADPWSAEHDDRDHEFWIEQEQMMDEAIVRLAEAATLTRDMLRRLRGMRGGIRLRLYQTGAGSHYKWERVSQDAAA
jgi:hypothetical protein